ncbi:MAG: hypothetical protein PHW60_14205, partial [Kiritimatiellae bacterium]|nr:hypothetical protein [Kiritimatiellia bacterium]
MLFRQTLVPGYCLFTTDDNIGAFKLVEYSLFDGWGGVWGDTVLLGMPNGIGLISWNFISFCLLPVTMHFNWGHALDLIIASMLLALFLRKQKIGWPAIALGLLAAFWLASNFTLTYAGHVGKYGVLVMAAMALYCIWRALSEQPSILWGILAGGAIGYMFLEQLDIALFFGFMLGAYALFLAVRQWQANGTWVKSAVALVLMGGVGILIAGSTMFGSYTSNVKGAVSMQTESPREKWDYVTQWSWPPE